MRNLVENLQNLRIFNIAIVAGETSGDMLGAELIKAVKNKVKTYNAENQNQTQIQINFFGIGGSQMQQAGCKLLFTYDELAVMGYIDAIKNSRRIYKIRQNLKNAILQQSPHTSLFIGIDAPDFNLDLEKYLKGKNIKTIHYVSPSVWAWRKNRIKKIKQAADEILLLFPHEQQIYDQIGLKNTFVGHSLADNIDFDYQNNEKIARETLHLNESDNDENKNKNSKSEKSEKSENPEKPFPIFALLPGSRVGEIEQMAAVFLETAETILQYREFANAKFLLPLANANCKKMIFTKILPKFDHLIEDKNLMIMHGHADLALAAADVSLVASGTATLQAALYKKPLVVAYKTSPFMFWLAKKLVYSPYISLPNILCDAPLIPEILQDEMKADNLANTMMELYFDENNKKLLVEKFTELHKKLKQNSAAKIAERIFSYLI